MSGWRIIFKYEMIHRYTLPKLLIPASIDPEESFTLIPSEVTESFLLLGIPRFLRNFKSQMFMVLVDYPTMWAISCELIPRSFILGLLFLVW